MSTKDNDRELEMARLLQQLSETDIQSEASQVDSKLESLSNQELQELHAAGKCLNLLQKLGSQPQSGETIASSDDTQRRHQFENRRQETEVLPPSDGLSQKQPPDGHRQHQSAGRDMEVGTQFGRYEIRELAAVGGMARIYRAWDPALQREVALKVPLPQMLAHDPMIGERFRREGQSVALLSHPAIVPVFEAGEVDGSNYISLQWIPGQNLHQFLKQHIGFQETELDCNEAAAAMALLSGAVAHAHAKGILHRDIKPANILVETFSEDLPWHASLRITDFGLAKAFAGQNNTVLTANESIIGTPAYMSPESVHEDAVVDQRSDVYSLGVLLFELLVGQPPHKRNSYISTIRAIESDSIPSLRSRRSDVPADLDAICMKCVARDPSDRYDGAFELEADLNSFLAGQPVKARRIGSVGQLFRWTKRNPIVAASLSVAFLALLAGLITTSWLWRSADHSRQAAVIAQRQTEKLQQSEMLARKRAESKSNQLEKQVEILQAIFFDLDPVNERPGEGTLRERLADRLVESSQLIAQASDQEPQRSRLLGGLSRALAQLGRPRESHQVIRQAIENSRGLISADDELRLQKLLGCSLAALSRFQDAIDQVDGIVAATIASESLSRLEKAEAINLIAESHYNIALTLGKEDRYESAARYYQMLLKLPVESESGEPDELQLLRLVSTYRLAAIDARGQPTDEHFEKVRAAIGEAEAALGRGSAICVTQLTELANLYVVAKQHKQAMECAEDAYERATENFGPLGDPTNHALMGLLTVCGQVGSSRAKARLKEILPEAQRSMELQLSRKGELHRNAIIKCSNVSTAWSVVGQLDKGIEIKGKLVQRCTEEFGRDDSLTMTLLMGLGIMYSVNGQYDEAVETLSEFQGLMKTFPDRDQKQWKERLRVVRRQQLILAGMQLIAPSKRTSKVLDAGRGVDAFQRDRP